MKKRTILSAVTAPLLLTTTLHAQPSVDGLTISWPDDGWYQVQTASGTDTLCNGTRSCVVPSGEYIVINHSTGQRWDSIVVPASAIEAPATSIDDNSPNATAPDTSLTDFTLQERTFTFPDNGWYEVQSAIDYSTLCAGDLSCTVTSVDVVSVINHTTSERWNSIQLPVQSATDTASDNGLNVVGNTISWPDDGWYQVLNDQWQSICDGGTSCTVTDGTYSVINHTTGLRWDNLVITTEDTAPDSGIDSSEPADPALTDTTLAATVTVMNQVISWPDNGWYQVQSASTFESLCEGGTSCSVPPGFYHVINLSTGERWNSLEVPDMSDNSNDTHSGETPDTTPRTDEPDPFNERPRLVAADDVYFVLAGDTLTATVTAYDDSQHLDITILSHPPGVTATSTRLEPVSPTTPSTGKFAITLNWTPYDNDLGEHEITLSVSDGLLTSREIALNVIVSENCASQSTVDSMSLDCANSNDAQIVSNTQSSDRFYQSDITGIGDFNGDGIDDIAITSVTEHQDTGYTYGYIVYGTAGLLSEELSEEALDTALNTSGGMVLTGDFTPSSQTTLISAGDFNRDGFQDITLNLLDRLVVVYGNASHATTANLSLNTTDGQFTSLFVPTLFSQHDTQFSVQSAGDFDGDGFSDLLLNRISGEMLGDDLRFLDVVVVLYGSNSLPGSVSLFDLGPERRTVITEEDAFNTIELDVFASGDVNSDTLGDIVIANANTVAVVFGNRTRADRITLDKDLVNREFSLLTTEHYNADGGGGAGGGDFNGDGIADIVISRGNSLNNGVTPVIDVIGGTSDFPARATTDALKIKTVIVNDDALSSPQPKVALKEDMNGDGYDDIVATYPIESLAGINGHSVQLIYGTTTSATTSFETLNASSGFRVYANPANHLITRRAVSVGDINADGFADIGIALDSYFSNFSGNYALVFGR